MLRPSLASSSAYASPIPDDAPVTIAHSPAFLSDFLFEKHHFATVYIKHIFRSCNNLNVNHVMMSVMVRMGKLCLMKCEVDDVSIFFSDNLIAFNYTSCLSVLQMYLCREILQESYRTDNLSVNCIYKIILL
uniref:SJCHGC09228 protein n=1 Tax=Schistosoma japonicum TaxID=6182 RepID=Q5DF33_SCHJA|nr:SJCHGC09228 protein [Schistosoma japonicum]